MATYKVTINERTKEGRELIATIRKSKVVEFNRDLHLSDPTKMTKEEFYAQINEALEQVKRGEYIELKTSKDIKNYMRNI